jgi:hypothetical protein
VLRGQVSDLAMLSMREHMGIRPNTVEDPGHVSPLRTARRRCRWGLVNAAVTGSPVYGVVLICARANRKLRTGPFVLTSMALTS